MQNHNNRGNNINPETATAGNYNVPEGEEHKYHVKIEVKAFNPSSGEKLSKARIQKIGKKNYESIVSPQLIRQGYTVTVLHNPNDWLEKNEAELKDRNAKRAQDAKNRKDEADQAKIDQAVKEALEKQQNQFNQSIGDIVNKAVSDAVEAEKKKKLDAQAKASTDAPKAEGAAATGEAPKETAKTAKADTKAGK